MMASAAESPRPGPVQRALAVSLALVVVWGLVGYPLIAVPLAIGLAIYALALARVPLLWLVVVPATLPTLDFARWTGRFYFDEFDLVVVTTLAVLSWRVAPTRDDFLGWGRWGAIAVLALALSYAVGTVIGLWPPAPLDGNAFALIESPYNALRVAKGFAWPLALAPFLGHALRRHPGARNWLAAGMLIGLAGVVSAAVVERFLFVGLRNFEKPFRITATFSSMATGGQHIDGYLAAVLPFIAVPFFVRRGVALYLAVAILFALAVYTLMVTYSRAPLIAAVAACIVLALGLIAAARHWHWRSVLTSAVLVAVAAWLAVPVIEAPFMQKRLETIDQDMTTRTDHWRNILSLRREGLASVVLGEGVGSFARLYRERSTVDPPPAQRLFPRDGDNAYLRLTSGDYTYINQLVSTDPGADYTLSFDIRSTDRGAALTIPICERSLLYTFKCRWLESPLRRTDGAWEHHVIDVNMGAVGKSLGRRGLRLSRRPVDLSLFFYRRQPGAAIDVDNIKLVDTSGRDLIANGDFSRGNDRWFFMAENHLSWHAKNLAVHLLFEQGYYGLASFALLVVAAFAALTRQIAAGDRLAAVLMASLTGYLAVGVFGSLLDAPRIATLFYLIAFTALATPRDPSPSA